MLFQLTNRWLTTLSHWLLPQSCFLCGETSTQVICVACLSHLPYQTTACPRCGKTLSSRRVCWQCRKQSPAYNHTHAVFTYTYPINQLISAAKFHQNLAVLRLLGDLMAQQLPTKIQPDALIPVPLHPKRLRQRGYNQSLELAKRITKPTGIPLSHQTCRRIKNTPPQVSLSGQQRQTNMVGAFQLTQLPPSWQHIVIIDDVMTTGATVGELASLFKQAGIQRVDIWCCARR